MQRKMVLTGLALVVAATFGMGVAAEEPPRIPPQGIEGPDIRVAAEPHRTACDGVRLVSFPASRGVEGPETR